MPEFLLILSFLSCSGLAFTGLYLLIRWDERYKAQKQAERERPAREERQRIKEVEIIKFYDRERTPQSARYEIEAFYEELETRYIYHRPSMWRYPDLTKLEIQERIAFLEKKAKEPPVEERKQPELTPESKPELPPGVVLGTKSILIFSTNPIKRIIEPAVLPDAVRDRDLYIVGKKRTGKSTLLLNLANYDILSGSGVAVIDPHGDLVESLLDYIPRERVQDTIYFDAADKEHPIPLSVFNASNEDEIARLADDLIVIFKRLSESWGDRMENILRYTFHTLLRVEGTTFLNIQHILQDESYREQILSRIQSQPILSFWRQQFPQLPKDAVQPILSRMSRFILSPVLSAILGSSRSALNFNEVIEHKKIFLANISDGKIGEETSKLLGSLLVSQIQLAIMRRANIPKEQRELYFLYVDEFQNFTSSAFDKILSEAGKYKLSLTIAHQYISQLDDRIRRAILGNVGSMVMFALGLEDARHLRGELGEFEPEDLARLNPNNHEALYRPATGAKDTALFNSRPPAPRLFQSFADAVKHHTQITYSRLSDQKTEKVSTIAPLTKLERPHRSAIAPASSKEFTTNQDKILYYLNQAQYLSTQQIITLCYSHITESARATTASRDLRALVAGKKIKEQTYGRGKIYYIGKTCNPTDHNLGIRDLFLKIIASGFEIAEVNFFPVQTTITPDLFVSFFAHDGTLIKSFWEYDTGTEGVGEIVKKVKRYVALCADHLITIVVTTPERLAQLRKAIKEPFVTFAVMSELSTLNDFVFQSAESQQPFSFFL